MSSQHGGEGDLLRGSASVHGRRKPARFRWLSEKPKQFVVDISARWLPAGERALRNRGVSACI